MLGEVVGDREVIYSRLKLLPVLPLDFSIKAPMAVTRSTMPLLNGAEIGKGEGVPEPRLRRHVYFAERPHVSFARGIHEAVERNHAAERPGHVAQGGAPEDFLSQYRRNSRGMLTLRYSF